MHPQTCGLVPTMGALHEGHIALIRKARKCCERVVVSIFVNPTQFGPGEDLERYPRTLETDLEICAREGVDFVFAPSAAEMYRSRQFLSIQIEALADHLCGATRAGHFNGVLQIVNKLFQIVHPAHAFFGQKDIQQFRLIETMVDEFNIPVVLHRVPTIREHDGLALSSRNRYLSPAERESAPALYRALQELSEGVLIREEGDRGDKIPKQIASARKKLEKAGFRIDYVSVVDYETLQPVGKMPENRQHIVAGAAWLGSTRLIDNILVTARPAGQQP